MDPRSSPRFGLRRYGAAVERHAHDHHQLVLGLDGRLDMAIDGRPGTVRADTAGVVTGGLDHGFASEGPNGFLVVDLPRTPGDGHDRFWAAAAERPFVAVDADLQGFCRVVAAATGQGRLDGPKAEAAGALLIDALARGAGLDPDPVGRPLARALAFVDRHAAEPVTVAAIAAAAGVSESRLHRLFVERLGRSPARHLASVRLARARALLEGSDAPVAEVALAAGYGDQSAFTRAFRRDTGETPAAFRRARQDRHRNR